MPQGRSGNPGVRLKRAQQKACFELLREELRLFKPKRVLFLTGQVWADPFLEEFGVGNDSSRGTEYVQSFGKLEVDDATVDFVVAKHPRGKPEKEITNEVLNSFVALGAGGR